MQRQSRAKLHESASLFHAPAFHKNLIHAHKVFKETSPLASKVQYPLISDRNHSISKAYQVLNEEKGAAERASILILYPEEVGRNTYELLRIVQALHYATTTNTATPANWVPGQQGIHPNTNQIGR
ncbi:peroxiredoxin [Fictibacillus macauensis ZFHKF-1]|uniref:Peroxiredoxin n=1 Tax=Fictibacillus macauensis ZFHKF-1 TaxID=1196324 RepID=I8UCR4_9BACL|nr:peroxiredoxin [Fictibacillus macauensis ZFHKF-1]